MTLELCPYCVSESDSKRPIIGRSLESDNVPLEDKATKVRPSGVIPDANHVHLSRWAGIRSPSARVICSLRTRSHALVPMHRATRDTAGARDGYIGSRAQLSVPSVIQSYSISMIAETVRDVLRRQRHPYRWKCREGHGPAFFCRVTSRAAVEILTELSKVATEVYGTLGCISVGSCSCFTPLYDEMLVSQI